MQTTDWIADLFRAIDASDTDAFMEFVADDAVFRFGNAPAVKGSAAIRDTVAGFFGSIKALHHHVAESWTIDDDAICHGIVTYTRHDGSQLTVPFANVFKMRGELIHDYLIFTDVSQLHAQG